MATKSFLKDVVISDPKVACKFADTLICASKNKYKNDDTKIKRECIELKDSEIKEFFDIK